MRCQGEPDLLPGNGSTSGTRSKVDKYLGGPSTPLGTREQADQIVLKLREAGMELSRGKALPEAAKNLGVTE
jgi:hypothetical protein